MAQPRSAQNIVPVTQVCKTFSANRPCALFIRVPPECTLNASSCRLSVCYDVVGVLFHDLRWLGQIQDARFTVARRHATCERVALSHRRWTLCGNAEKLCGYPRTILDAAGNCRCIHRERENLLRTSTHMLPRERVAVTHYCRRWRRGAFC